MKKRWLIGVVFIILIVLGIWQWENIQIVITGVRYSTAEIENQMNKCKEDTKITLQKYNITGIRDLTIEEERQLMDGELSVEDAIELIMNTESRVRQQSDVLAEKDKIAEKHVGEMYVLQVTNLSALGNIESRARDLYNTLPKEERNLMGAKKLAGPFMDEISALEGECDAKVEVLLSSMKNELEKVGGDTSIIETMRNSYNTQKRLRKSYYLSAIK